MFSSFGVGGAVGPASARRRCVVFSKRAVLREGVDPADAGRHPGVVGGGRVGGAVRRRGDAVHPAEAGRERPDAGEPHLGADRAPRTSRSSAAARPRARAGGSAGSGAASARTPAGTRGRSAPPRAGPPRPCRGRSRRRHSPHRRGPWPAADDGWAVATRRESRRAHPARRTEHLRRHRLQPLHPDQQVSVTSTTLTGEALTASRRGERGQPWAARWPRGTASASRARMVSASAGWAVSTAQSPRPLW